MKIILEPLTEGQEDPLVLKRLFEDDGRVSDVLKVQIEDLEVDVRISDLIHAALSIRGESNDPVD